MENQYQFTRPTTPCSILRHLPALFIFIFLPGIRAWAQVPVCNDMVVFAVDGACSATIIPEDILEGGPYNYPDYTVQLDKDGGCNGPWLSPTLGIADINQTYCARVTYTVNNNTCTTTVQVRDNLAPIINCPPDQTIQAAATTWLPVGTPGLSPGVVYWTALAFSGTTPYVAFQDNANGGKATVMKYDGAMWVNVGPPNFSAGGMNYTALAFSGPTPYVAYQDNANGGKVTVMKFNGAMWVNVGAPGFSAGQADWVNLVFSGATPYVAFKDYGNGGKVTVMQFNGTSWVNVGAPGFSAGTADFTALAFSGTTPYVAYKDAGNGGKATVMQFDGANWVNVGTPGFSAGSVEFTALACSGPTPYVAYTDVANGYKATLMKYDGVNWVPVGTPGFSAGQAYSIALALSGTTPFVAYMDNYNGNEATVQQFNGTNWVNVGQPAFSAGQVNYTDFAFSGTTPYLSYTDGANNDKATVMKLVSTDCNAPVGDWTSIGSATDNCTTPVPVTQVPAASTLLSGNNAQTTVKLMATDNYSNTSSCTFKVTLNVTETCDGYDNDCDGLIDEGCPIAISGRVLWSEDQATGVNMTSVKLTGSATPPVVVTGPGGVYGFATAVSSGSFTVKPTKTINKLNGLTVADVTAVQQHVANLVPITDPYKQIAADVNRSNSINSLDASLINQALLGNPLALSQLVSWRFVPASYSLSVPPWGFPERIDLTGIASTQVNQDFFGIKTGDVAATFANPFNFSGGSQSSELVLYAADQALEAGATLTVDCTTGQTDDLAAFQLALEFDPAQLQLLGIDPEGSGLPLTLDHFGTYNAGEIRVVWSKTTGVALSDGTRLFLLKFKVLQSGGQLSDALYLEESEFPALAYTGALAESGVQLRFTDATTGTGTPQPGGPARVQLFQNQPNPFRKSTTIAFYLPESAEATLRILDATGRLVEQHSAVYPAGRNTVSVHPGNQTKPGVLFYELVTAAGKWSGKMLLVGE